MEYNLPSVEEINKGSFLLLNKPEGWTSFDVVGKVRQVIRKLNKGQKIKIGHAGTLDPLATGLLILCTGGFTKRISEFQEYDKEYTGTMVLGATTPSFDLETEVSEYAADISFLKDKDIIELTKEFIGEQKQLPPIHSAVKINGRRAYDYARTGEEVIVRPRIINIKEFEISYIKLPEAGFRMVVSKGTYVRSVINDFGKKLNCGAYLFSLCRTRIGIFDITQALTPEEFETHYLMQL